MKVALAQINPTVGDLSGNAALIERAVADAAGEGADLVICPELAISGYPPKDALLREGFVPACDAAVRRLASAIDPDIGLVLGHPTAEKLPEGRIANAASLLHKGRVLATAHKMLLPNYDVFDEHRYFRQADSVEPIPFGGRMLGIHICEDAWWREPETFYHDEPANLTDPVARLVEAGADLLINVSASPFEIDKPLRRGGIVKRHVERHGVPFIFVNQVGGNDDLVFDGYSFVLDEDGHRVLELPRFQSALATIDLDRPPKAIPPAPLHREPMFFEALVLGLGDYVRKCGFTDLVLGLSGGIDSTLAACIAAEAVGREHVHALLMPSRYSSEHSVADAELLAQNLGIDYATVPIEPMHRAYQQAATVGPELTEEPGGLADQNLQARIRGACVMIRSNKNGWLAVATGNKSELAVGYCTLYGDMAGGFAVLCDVFKQDVYAVSQYVNERAGREIIPQHIIEKRPSAELAPDQFDEDSLPPYELLDPILEGLIEKELSVATLSRVYPKETVEWVARQLDRNEFKRRQMPPGIKLSSRAFGSGRRMPMAARFDWT